MDRARTRDWLAGAAGLLLLQVAAVAVLWWLVTDPAGDPARPGASPPLGSERPLREVPPAGLGDDDLWLTDLALDAGTVVAAGSALHDVRAVGHDVVAHPDGLVAGRVSVDATVPFQVVAEELGERTTVAAAEDGEAMVVRSVEVLGRELHVVATGSVEVEAGRLVVEPSSIDLGGPDFVSDAVAAAVRRLVTIEHEVEGLPEGLVLHGVAVQPDGFRAHLRGEDVRLLR